MVLNQLGRKVDFLIAGTQKGGTSALTRYLRRHPAIGMAKRKELHFFDNERIFSQPKIDYSLYESQFEYSLKRKYYGEATPIYIYWEPSCKRIWEYNSEIKLIFILRNPIERAFSHWNMEYDRNVETNDFSYCIRNEEQRVKQALPHQHRVYSYIDRGFYSEQINRYKKHFRDEQMLFIKYKEFRMNQKKELHKIFDFLRVNSNNFNFQPETVHTRRKHAILSIQDTKYLIYKFEKDIKQVENLLNWNCQDWLES